MKIDVYKSIINSKKYLSVPAGLDVEKHQFPADNFDPELMKLSPFKSSMEIQPGDKRVAMDSAKIIDDIQKDGYAMHSAAISISVQTVPRR